MKQIPFGEFFNGVRDKLTDSQLRLLDGNDICFLADGAYVSLSVGESTIWLAWVVGNGLKWMHELRQAARKCGFKFVQFQTKIDNKSVNAMARYWKAKATPKGEFIVYTINLETRS